MRSHDPFQCTINENSTSNDSCNFGIVADAATVHSIGYRFVKRFIDVLVSFLGLLILAPLFLFIGILIRLTSNESVFYAYDEIGRGGKQFRCYKFRTMVPNADALLEKMMHMNEMNGPVFKMRDDPRITKFGCLLRKYSVDELPQLWCVLRGEMSLVGPRPAMPREWEQYEPWQRRRLSVTPGITGMWQAYGRNQVSDFDKWAKLDLGYIDNWSLWLDMKILLRTAMVVLRGTGV